MASCKYLAWHQVLTEDQSNQTRTRLRVASTFWFRFSQLEKHISMFLLRCDPKVERDLFVTDNFLFLQSRIKYWLY